MCMSPDEMSDDRIREVIAYFTEEEPKYRAVGDLGSARICATRIENFTTLLREREQERQADIDEILAPVLREVEATPLRETVTV